MAVCVRTGASSGMTVPGRLSTGFKVPAIAQSWLAMLLLSCGDATVAPPPPPPAPVPTTVTVSPASATLAAIEETTRFTAEVRDQNGQVMGGASVAWASSDASVATVDASGLVTAAANGSATLTATAGSVAGTAAVTVAQVVSAVAVSPATDTLVAFGDTVRLAAEATDANGHALAAVTEFEWSSSDTLVARVDDSGLVESLAEGEASVTATASGVTGGTELTVVPPLATTIAAGPDTVRFTALGQAEQLAAEVRDQAGRVMAEPFVSWLSGDTLVVVVDSAGLVTAVGPGITTVTAVAGDVSDAVVVTVTQSAGSVLVSPAEGTIAPGGTLQLTAEAFDENGHRVESSAFSWSSSNTGVARVDDTGLVEGVAEGTARIRATAGDASGVAEVTVENPDRAALVALYEATDGPSWIDNTNWLTDAPLGEWYGVETDASGRIVRLDLSGRWEEDAREYKRHGLSGTLPPELGLLTELERLDLSMNNLRGALPPELGDLVNLRWLVLDLNTLSGPIPPGIGNLASLSVLNLGNNALSGAIPTELGNLAHLRFLRLGWNTLSGPIPPGLGNLANLIVLDLAGNALSGPIPPDLGSLRNLRDLNLQSNAMTGPIPLELGTLAELRSLYLQNNRLTGPVPETFLQLDRLWSFYLRPNNGLCVPGTSAFVAWLRAIEDKDGSEALCNAADVRALIELHEATGGTAWIESDGWSGDGAVEDWYGVTADSLGRVTILDLSHNALAGQLPRSLGELAHLAELRISGNTRLSGRLPLSLAQLPLRALHYPGTGLCAPVDASFSDWLSAIPSHEGTGARCAPLSDREILEVLYHVTDGPNWTDNDNWLSDAPLDDWLGILADRHDRVIRLFLGGLGLTGRLPPELGGLTRLTSLSLEANDLTGPIPSELGRLTGLSSLALAGNALTGPIPPQLGNLAKLKRLRLFRNELSGPIPPELGDLTELRLLKLNDNSLTGRFPPELLNLARLETLELGSNSLSGTIPPGLGSLGSIKWLDLSGNRWTGSIPPELGNLTHLEALRLYGTDLTGPIPSEFGNLISLTWLRLDRNRLTGPIPPQLGKLAGLVALFIGENNLTGPIPPELGNLASLEQLQLGINNLTGTIPPELGDLASLRDLVVGYNSLTGGR